MADLGLYIHVPFCRSKCAWCDFSSEVGTSGVDRWFHKILSQLKDPPDESSRWATVYFGGGTPTLLEPQQLQRLLSALEPRLVPGAEVTLEANPESLTADHLAVFSVRGTRLSLGIQTFQPILLSRYGRSTRDVHLKAARRLVERWSGRLSLDLICGLGGQTAETQAEDLEEALSWNPDHVSWYSLTVEPSTPLGRALSLGTAGLPSDAEAAEWWLAGRDRLESSGLLSYEVSNFARPGAESIHNGRYWSLSPWWGLGPSAHSYLPSPGGPMQHIFQAPRLQEWLSGVPPSIEIPSRLETAKDQLLAGLRRSRGVEASPWADLLPQTLDRWEGKVQVQDGRLFLSREAFPLLDSFLRTAYSELDGRPEFR